MLDSIRSSANSWLAKLLLAILVVSFAAWGISGSVLTGGGSSDVVKAGDTSVSMLDYRFAYDRRVSELSQRFGTRLTSEQVRALGVPQQVLSQLVAGAVLDELTRKMNLGVSEEKLAQLTASDPAFRGPDGNFNRQQFEYVLRQVGMNPDDYIRSRADLAARQQIIEATTDGMHVPDTLLRAVSLYRGEDRTVEYVPLPVSLVQPVEDPSAEALKTYFEANKAKYAAPEYRKISYLRLDPEDIADPSSISDEQVREYYETSKDSYTTPEKRTIQQLVFADKDAANAALQSTRTGMTFEDLVQAQGKTLEDVELGTFTKADIADEAVANAAFKLSKNQVSDVVDGQFGPVILRVTEIQPASVKPVEEVSDEIRKRLALEQANRDLLDVNDRYQDMRAGGATLAEAAQKLNLEVKTVEAVDRTGHTPDGGMAKDLPESETLLEQAFETDAGIENDPINTKNNGFLYYEVGDIIPAHDRELEEVRADVVADWKDEEAEKRLSAKAAEYEKQLKDGKTLEDIAKEAGQEVQTKRGLSRGNDDADIGKAGVAAVFGVPKGGTGVFANPAGDAKFLFKVTEVFEPAGAGPESVDAGVKEAMVSGMSNDILDQLVMKLQKQYEVTVNQDAVARAMNQ
jgi:peptidyl-prolyl cis-trans isomerase D